MRIQQLELLDLCRLDEGADRWSSRRVRRAASRFLELVDRDDLEAA